MAHFTLQEGSGDRRVWGYAQKRKPVTTLPTMTTTTRMELRADDAYPESEDALGVGGPPATCPRAQKQKRCTGQSLACPNRSQAHRGRDTPSCIHLRTLFPIP